MIRIVKDLFSILDDATRRQFWFLVVMMLVGALLEMVGVGLFIPLFNLVANPEQTGFLSQYFPFLSDGSAENFIVILIAISFVFLVKNVFLLLITYVQHRFINKKLASVQRQLFSRYMCADYSFHLRRNSAELMRNVAHSTPDVFVALMHLTNVILEVIQSIAIWGVLLWQAPSVTLGIVGVLGTASFAIYRLTRGRSRRLGEINHTCQEEKLRALRQGFGAVKEIMVLGRQQESIAAVAKPIEQLSHANVEREVLHQVPRNALEVFAIIGLTGVSAIFLQYHSVQDLVPTLGLFVIVALRLFPSANRILLNMNGLRFVGPAVAAISSDLALPSKPLPPKDRRAADFDHDFCCENLYFRYPEQDQPALDGIDLTIKKGEAVAFVGQSGAGKSTLADILLGLLPPTAGKLLLDGRDVADDLRGWQDLLGYVPQDIFLCDDSLRRNIALGIAADEIDENRLARAVELAQLSAVAANLPNGLDTILGEDGVRLSGGQRQRVGIARALYHRPQVLILDEATSALDNETEREITRAIESLHGHITIILIAHRLSTVQSCDRLFFMDKGKIVAEGSFQELIEKNQDFAGLVRLGRLGGSLSSSAPC